MERGAIMALSVTDPRIIPGEEGKTMAENVNSVAFNCALCPEVVTGINAADDHLRLMHPDEYGTGPERWPDGAVVLEDHTLDPSDFGSA
jgi:hypothetical protein